MIPILSALFKLCIVTLIGSGVGFAFKSTISGALIGGGITLIIQIIIGWVMSVFERVRAMKYIIQQRLDEQAILDSNTITVECAACKTPHSLPIMINERNTFICSKCKAESVVVLSPETALVTKNTNV